MGIRFPLQDVLSYNSVSPGHGGPASLVGGVAKTFTLPQDTDNVVVKLTASIVGGGVSATFQTTDDGGITWYDVQRTSIVSYTGNSVLGGANTDAEWLVIPVATLGLRPTPIIASVVAVGSVVSIGSVFTTVGASGASTLGQKAISGLPILAPYNRIFLRYTAGVSSIQNEAVTVSVNSQSGTR